MDKALCEANVFILFYSIRAIFPSEVIFIIMESKVQSIHLLFKGERSDDNYSDDYVKEFRGRQLVAAVIPILDINFKVGALVEALKNDTFQGLIVTSTRVVEALVKSTNIDRDVSLTSLRNDLIFLVGPKSGQEFKDKLNLDYNLESTKTGDGKVLASYIKNYCQSKYPSEEVKLLYPKSSLSDNAIELALRNTGVIVKSLIAYETMTIENFTETVVQELEKFRESNGLILNLIFFSPSGVNGFLKFGEKRFVEHLESTMNLKVRLRFSSIGKTTMNCLLKNKMKVYCVSDEPNPTSLVTAILNSNTQE